MNHCLNYHIQSWKIESLIRECYILNNEDYGTETKDVIEFSTLLNATGRYNHANVGLEICIGNRTDQYITAKKLLKEHRSNIVLGLNYIKKNGFIELSNIQYINTKYEIKDTIIGIVAGMSMNIDGFNHSKPIIAFSYTVNNDIKVSSRTTSELIRNGINLAIVMEKASKYVGGSGGGHDIAAGATIPFNKMDEFIIEANKIVGIQKSNNI